MKWSNLIFMLLTIIRVFGQETMYYNQYKTYSDDLFTEAKNGNIRAVASLGSCYDRGDGVSQNRNEAFKLFQIAAEKGDCVGMYNLALYYQTGYVTEQDLGIAIDWYKKAIAKDYKFVPAYFQIASIYEKGGPNFIANPTISADYWEGLANLGSTIGEYYAGRNYLEGIGREINLDIAKKYLLSASNKGLKNKDTMSFFSMDLLASCYKREQNFEEAAKWLIAAYERGFLVVCNNLGDMYYYGRGVQQSYEKAFEVFSKGAQDTPRCKFRLSLMYRDGLGVAQDTLKASVLLEDAAKAGINTAQFQYASDKYTGTYTERDYGIAVEYYLKVLEDKFIPKDIIAETYLKLSSCYRFGRGVPIDIGKADNYLELANELGEPNAENIFRWLNMLR